MPSLRGRRKQNKREKRGNERTVLSFFSFDVSFGLPFFFSFGTADLDDSGARDPSANVVASTKAVVFVNSSDFAVASVCACACAWAAAESAARASSSGQDPYSVTNG